MIAHSILTIAQNLGNFPIREAADQQLEHLQFPGRQLMAVFPSGENRPDAGLNPFPASVNVPDLTGELIQSNVFQLVPGSSGLQSLINLLFIRIAGKHQYLGIVAASRIPKARIPPPSGIRKSSTTTSVGSSNFSMVGPGTCLACNHDVGFVIRRLLAPAEKR
jgi:hypothetical protein